MAQVLTDDPVLGLLYLCLIGGILSFQFVRALVKRPKAHRPLQLVAMTLACLGVTCSTLSTWLTCQLASSEQQRMFLEREHSLHHSHEMAEKEMPETSANGLSKSHSTGTHLHRDEQPRTRK
ncbi:hypothetical protein SKAU_G00206130 [Synaphobranchus kaupii]|uniref:Transmembrane protein 196 n=1 Tax=Synaphobranchus kaupii TaxID=118154 RepID=A0A9Q1IXS2_SYNKA|nr:hypothetical protein SKAU_G00206130 [Synaphobranchus kaupii]